MENASKALIMAGSVLMALLVIGALVFMYNQLTKIEQAKTDVDETSKMVEYQKRFEQYNKTIYGSELMSLANLQEDYNRTQSGEKGYAKIIVTVTIKKSIAGTKYFSAGKKKIELILSDVNSIEENISNYETKAQYKGKTVKYYSQISNKEIANIYDISYNSSEPDYEIAEKLSKDSRTEKLMQEIENYKNLKTTYTEFKTKRFKCINIEYDKVNGRIISMDFVEQS